jgi:esterase/lipase superfamily enzyme
MLRSRAFLRPKMCQTFKLAGEATPLADQATVDFLFATTRAKLQTPEKLTYSGDRSKDVTFGAARRTWP